MSLVITIVILIILAGISINMLTGENGIIERAKYAKEQTLISQYKEQIDIIKLETKTDNTGNSTNLDTLKEAYDTDSTKSWITNTEIITDNEIKKIKLTTKEGYIFYVTENTTEYKGKGEFTDTSALQKTDVIELKSVGDTANGKSIRITNLAEDYYTIEYQINGTANDKWANIESGNTIDVKFGEILYGRLVFGSNYGEIHSISILADILPPKDFIPQIKKGDSLYKFSIYVDVSDSEATEESSMSGIKKYEYYINGEKKATLVSNEYEIENTNTGTYNIYVIAYDNSDNAKESYHIDVLFEEKNLITDYSNAQKYAFSNNNNSTAYKVFDNNTSTYWDGGNINSYIGYDFVNATEISKVRISQPYNSDVIRYFKIQYSDDGVNYIDASNQLEYILGNGTQTFILNNNVGAHRYWRYQNISNYTNNAYCAISELEFIKYVGPTQSTVVYTNKENSNSKKTFSNNYSSEAYKAFDNNLNTYWDGRNIDSYVGYIFTEPISFSTVRISQPYSSDVIRYFKIQYSDDGVNYIDASNQLEYILGNSTQTFSMNNNVGAHRYWRYQNISNYTNNAYCAISELEFIDIIKIE